jgi:hypothetical protein
MFGQPSDLWQYDPTINQWAWMGNFGTQYYGTQGVGSSLTMPGGRNENTTAWTDATGNLWLWGGLLNGPMADMWKYDVSTGIWTWMSGSSNPSDPGSYGTIGVPSTSNYPASRMDCTFWKDNTGNFWLASGYDGSSGFGFNDVWKFNPLTLEWTWVSGAQITDTGMVSAGNCDTSYLNQPGPRWENRTMWKVCDDLVINFGGYNYDFFSGLPLCYNDMWAYKVSLGEWIRVADWPSVGQYGIKGVANAANYPAPRFGSIAFTDRHNNLWMFGGVVYPTILSPLTYNDLWRYIPDSTCLGSSCLSSRSCQLGPVTISMTDSVLCAGDSTQICAPSGFSSYNWNNSSTGQCIYAKLAGNYYVTVTDNNGCSTTSNHLPLTVHVQPPVSISVNGDTLRVYNSLRQQWFLNGNLLAGDTGKFLLASAGGDYTVQVTDSNGCVATSNKVVLGINSLSDDQLQIYPNPLSAGNWQLSVSNSYIGSHLEIFDDEGRVVYQSEIRNPHSEITFPAAKGIYILRVSSPNGFLVKKLVRL